MEGSFKVLFSVENTTAELNALAEQPESMPIFQENHGENKMVSYPHISPLDPFSNPNAETAIYPKPLDIPDVGSDIPSRRYTPISNQSKVSDNPFSQLDDSRKSQPNE